MPSSTDLTTVSLGPARVFGQMSDGFALTAQDGVVSLRVTATADHRTNGIQRIGPSGLCLPDSVGKQTAVAVLQAVQKLSTEDFVLDQAGSYVNTQNGAFLTLRRVYLGQYSKLSLDREGNCLLSGALDTEVPQAGALPAQLSLPFKADSIEIDLGEEGHFKASYSRAPEPDVEGKWTYRTTGWEEIRPRSSPTVSSFRLHTDEDTGSCRFVQELSDYDAGNMHARPLQSCQVREFQEFGEEALASLDRATLQKLRYTGNTKAVVERLGLDTARNALFHGGCYRLVDAFDIYEPKEISISHEWLSQPVTEDSLKDHARWILERRIPKISSRSGRATLASPARRTGASLILDMGEIVLRDAMPFLNGQTSAIRRSDALAALVLFTCDVAPNAQSDLQVIGRGLEQTYRGTHFDRLRYKAEFAPTRMDKDGQPIPLGKADLSRADGLELAWTPEVRNVGNYSWVKAPRDYRRSCHVWCGSNDSSSR